MLAESTDVQSSGARPLNSRGPETRCKPRLGIGTLREGDRATTPPFHAFSALDSVTPYGSRSRISHVVHKSTGTLPRVTARRETKRRHDAKIAARPTTRRPVACLAKRDDAAGRRRRRRPGTQRPEAEAVNWTSMTSWLDGMFLSRGVGRELGLWWCFTAKGKILMEDDEILLGDASWEMQVHHLSNPVCKTRHTTHLTFPGDVDPRDLGRTIEKEQVTFSTEITHTQPTLGVTVVVEAVSIGTTLSLQEGVHQTDRPHFAMPRHTHVLTPSANTHQQNHHHCCSI